MGCGSRRSPAAGRPASRRRSAARPTVAGSWLSACWPASCDYLPRRPCPWHVPVAARAATWTTQRLARTIERCFAAKEGKKTTRVGIAIANGLAVWRRAGVRVTPPCTPRRGRPAPGGPPPASSLSGPTVGMPHARPDPLWTPPSRVTLWRRRWRLMAAVMARDFFFCVWYICILC